MAEWLIGILAAVAALLAALLKASVGREKELKEDKRNAEDRARLIQSQMETVRECREELGLIEKESVDTVPDRKTAPPAGDSASRIGRLNSLHRHTKDG